VIPTTLWRSPSWGWWVDLLRLSGDKSRGMGRKVWINTLPILMVNVAYKRSRERHSRVLEGMGTLF